MKNNMRGLFFHIFIGIIMFGIAALLNINQTVVKIVYSSTLIKVILSIIPLVLYYNLGKGMSKKANPKLDFFAGNMIILICILLAAISLIGIKSEDNVQVAGTLWRLPMDMFMFSEVYLLELFGIKASAAKIVLSSFIPTIIYGLSIKKSRRRIYRQRMINSRKNTIR